MIAITLTINEGCLEFILWFSMNSLEPHSVRMRGTHKSSRICIPSQFRGDGESERDAVDTTLTASGIPLNLISHKGKCDSGIICFILVQHYFIFNNRTMLVQNVLSHVFSVRRLQSQASYSLGVKGCFKARPPRGESMFKSIDRLWIQIDTGLTPSANVFVVHNHGSNT